MSRPFFEKCGSRERLICCEQRLLGCWNYTKAQLLDCSSVRIRSRPLDVAGAIKVNVVLFVRFTYA